MIANGLWGWSYAKGFTLAGGLFLLVGLILALRASRAQSRAISASTPSTEIRGRPVDRGWTWRRLHLAEADYHFTLGIVLTALGVVFQTIGGLLSK